MSTLRGYIEQARATGGSSVSATDVFRLHDTYGFPYEMTRELLDEEDLSIEGDFETLMEEQRTRSRARGPNSRADGAAQTRAAAGMFAENSGFQTRFTGYETEQQRTTVGAIQGIPANGSSQAAETGAPADAPAAAGERYLIKLTESPFYPAGGGQVSDVGTIECELERCRASVENVLRLGDDQVLTVVVEKGTLEPGEQVLAQVDRAARRATESNHTATHLLHAALRQRLGDHVHQAGSYVGPDKLRFDFSHGQALSAEELRDVEDHVNEWIARGDPVRPITTTLARGKAPRRHGAVR